MADPILNLHRFNKFVPTDMDWHGTYAGGYCEVCVYSNGPEVGGSHTVAVRGTDDTALVRFFANWADALEVFNGLRYVQSDRDLTKFAYGLDGENNNGWPTERRILAPVEFAWPPPTAFALFDGVDYRQNPDNNPESGTPLPW